MEKSKLLQVDNTLGFGRWTNIHIHAYKKVANQNGKANRKHRIKNENNNNKRREKVKRRNNKMIQWTMQNQRVQNELLF